MNIWSDAKWIGLEQLEDSMKVVPAVHGSGNNLGNKAVKRSVVPMFRKEFQIDDDIESAVIHILGLGHYELHINGEKITDFSDALDRISRHKPNQQISLSIIREGKVIEKKATVIERPSQ